MGISKLIMYSHGIETLWFFSRQMAEEFERLGYEVYFFDPDSHRYDEFLRLIEFINKDSDDLNRCLTSKSSMESHESGVDDIMSARKRSDGIGSIYPKKPAGHIASVGFNFNGCSGEEFMYPEEGVHIYDKYHIPMINIVVDHPFYYHKFEPYLPKESYIQCSIDMEHEEYLKRFFPDIKRGPFIPLAGTDIGQVFTDGTDEVAGPCLDRSETGAVVKKHFSMGYSAAEPPGWDARPTDIMFAGNYNPPEMQDDLLKRNGPEYEKFYRDLIDDLIAHPEMEMTYAIEKHIRDGGFEDEITEESLKEVFPYMIVIDLYVRHFFRGEVVRILADAGIPIHVYGAGWEKLKTAHPENIISHGNVDSLTCLRAARKSKLSINVMPWFRRGAHDRVFNSMLNGSVCITDPSSYLQQEFTDGEDILFYSLNRHKQELYSEAKESQINDSIYKNIKTNIDDLPDLVTELLSDRSRWESIQLSAYKKSYAKHRWSSRADMIHKELLSRL